MLTLTKTSSLALALAAAACAFWACSSSSSSGPPASTGDDAGSSSGSTSSSGSGGGTCAGDGGKVPTNVTFDSMGKPTCAVGAGCDLSANLCCFGSKGGTCTPTATGCMPGYGSFGCIDDSTCPSGQVCCFAADADAGTLGSSCQTVAAGGKCSPAVTDTAGSTQLCQTNSECKSGCCAWQDCTVMGKALSLTMCGDPPTSSAFSCTKH